MPSSGRSGTAGDHPEPLVTGSLYCSGCLDDALLRAVVPLREALRGLGDDSLPYLWCVRYSRHGEHLKIRIHGPAALETAVRGELERAASSFLGAIGPPPEGAERRVRPESPPIDREDRLPEAPPDRSFRFTHYEISAVSLGGAPYLGDPGYRCRLTLCLARGCDLLLSWLDGRGEAPSHSQRQQILLRALISGLGSLELSRAQVAEYLAYHRDWMIRFPVLQQGWDEEAAAGVLADLYGQAEKRAPAVETLRSASRGLGDGGSPGAGGAWGQALAGLAGYLEEGFADAVERPDPFTRRPAFPGLFKAFHGLANQVGLKQVDEALAHHLLLVAVAPDEERHRRIALTPS